MRFAASSLVALALATAPAPPAGTASPAGIAPRAEAKRSSPTRPRYLALGDSYTIGESVAVADRFPVQLVRLLREAHVDVADPELVARTGFTTDELDQAIDAAAPRGPFALVTLLIGVNDQYRGRDLEGFRERYRALLGRAVGFAGAVPGHVIALTFPNWGETPFGAASGRDPARIGGEVARFNDVIREEAERAGVPVVRVAGLEDRDTTQFLAKDGLHPSGKLYALWAESTLPNALKALRTAARRSR